MQKSSTGSGEQAAAPISEAANPQTTAKPGETPDSPASGAAGAPAKSNSAKSAGAADAASGSTGATRGSSAETAASSDNEEAAQLKRHLAEQDAQINKLRNEQQAGAEREEADAAMQREQQSAAAMQREQQSAAAGTEQPGSPGASSSSVASKGQDEMAVFPANANAKESPGSESVAPRTLERSVYFGYNLSSVPEKYDSMLLANAAYLKAHPNITAEVQGNCDERGSREYNLALGARRAEAVKRALELAGADGRRINAVSYGSEKPVATGKDEESYSQNRRVDIVY